MPEERINPVDLEWFQELSEQWKELNIQSETIKTLIMSKAASKYNVVNGASFDIKTGLISRPKPDLVKE